jgi:hypothetical protein
MTIRLIVTMLGFTVQLISLYMAQDEVRGSTAVLLLGYAIILVGQNLSR